MKAVLTAAVVVGKEKENTKEFDVFGGKKIYRTWKIIFIVDEKENNFYSR